MKAVVGVITDLQPIRGADFIQTAIVRVCMSSNDGMYRQVVVRKEDFKLGGACVYIHPNAQLPFYPVPPTLDFLRPYRMQIKKRRFWGVESDGIALPMHEVIPYFMGNKLLWVGQDITKELGIKPIQKRKKSKTRVTEHPIKDMVLTITSQPYVLPLL